MATTGLLYHLSQRDGPVSALSPEVLTAAERDGWEWQALPPNRSKPRCVPWLGGLGGGGAGCEGGVAVGGGFMDPTAPQSDKHIYHTQFSDGNAPLHAPPPPSPSGTCLQPIKFQQGTFCPPPIILFSSLLFFSDTILMRREFFFSFFFFLGGAYCKFSRRPSARWRFCFSVFFFFFIPALLRSGAICSR